MEKFLCEVNERKQFSKGPCLYEKGGIQDKKKTCLQCAYFQKIICALKLPPMEIFTRYPPNKNIPLDKLEKIPEAYVSGPEIGPSAFFDLWRLNSRFEKMGNPVHAIEAFLIAHEAELYPPAWVIDWLLKAFRAYHVSYGKKDLLSLLGFRKSRGQPKAFKKAFIEARNHRLTWDVFVLNKFGGFSVKDAAEMVSNRLKNTPDWDKTGLQLTALDGPSLAVIYSNQYVSDFNGMSEELMEACRQGFERNKKEYLKQFPKIKKDSKPVN